MVRALTQSQYRLHVKTRKVSRTRSQRIDVGLGADELENWSPTSPKPNPFLGNSLADYKSAGRQVFAGGPTSIACDTCEPQRTLSDAKPVSRLDRCVYGTQLSVAVVGSDYR